MPRAAAGGCARERSTGRSSSTTSTGRIWRSFTELGIRTVFDLRTAAERSADPALDPDGKEQIVCDVPEDFQSAAPAELLKVISDRRWPNGCSAGAGRRSCSRGPTASRELSECSRRLSPVLHRDHRGRALAGALSLHDRQGPHRLGCGRDPDASGRLPRRRALRLHAHQPRPAPRPETGVRAVPGRRRGPPAARARARGRPGVPAYGPGRDDAAVRIDRGLLRRRAGNRLRPARAAAGQAGGSR